jgi:SAM-dependent methyltransferase
MPDLDWNHRVWDATHGWEKQGDEWSVAWGGARSQWYGSILPRLHRYLPTTRILEIAPGRGRWTQFLIPLCVEYVGVDLSAACIEACRGRFSAAPRARFFTNDGKSLAMAPDGCFDLVFSLDSLVHVEADVLSEYMWQICQKLTPTGVAFIHHSNAAGEGSDINEARRGARGESVSSAFVRQLVADCGHVVRVQEEVCWIEASRTDCFTLFGPATAFPGAQPTLLQNNEFIKEMELVRRFQAPYAAD